LQTNPQVLLLHVADPDPMTGGCAQTWPHIAQLSGSLVRFWQPFEHIVSPERHALQSVPAALHADGQAIIMLTHAPLASHTASDVLTPFMQDWSAPHTVPTDRLPLFTQAEFPVEHDVRPTLHGSDGVHATPAVQGTQLPALHTWFVPQLVPLASDVPLS
jgi:hypothetical protein